jgi:transposase
VYSLHEGWRLGPLHPHPFGTQHTARVYVLGDVHTQTIEGFWSLVKRGISGAYHTVSAKHLQSYLDEYSFRYDHRRDADGMFAACVGRIAQAQVAS